MTKQPKTLFNPATRRLIQNTSANRRRVNAFIDQHKNKNFFKDIQITLRKEAVIRSVRTRRDQYKIAKKKNEALAIKQKLRELKITKKKLSRSLKKVKYLKFFIEINK